MRAIEGQDVPRPTVDPRTLQDTRTAAPVEPPRPVVQPVGDTLASARAAFETHQARVEPVRQATSAEQRRPESDDIIAGLEAAALRDIGEELSRPATAAGTEERPARRNDAAAEATTETGGAKLTPEERLERRAAKQKNRAAEAVAAEPEKPGAAQRQARRAARMEKQASAAMLVATDPGDKERQERRAAKMKNQEGRGKGAGLPAPAAAGAVAKKKDAPVKKRDKGGPTISAPREWGIPWTAISFLAMVVIPAAVAAFYYIMLASPQYQVETQFAVRGSSQSSMATMGLGSILGGTTSQSGDSYIVTSYVESLQLIRDVQQELGIDLRQFYSRDHIDWLYRVEPDMPLEKFTDYWRSMTDVSYNATTGNTTLLVYGFTAEDSKAIADAVVKVAERLVNQLSESNRQQMMQVASKQVDRAEERLRKVQGEIRKLRIDEKVTDPATLIQLQTQAVSSLRSQLSTLETRYSALMKSVSPEAPQAKSLNKQIEALRTQITEQDAQLGNNAGDGKKNLSPEEKANLAEVLNKFEELTIEQSFATQAYTTALAAFETAIVEAQRQERYFATFVAPTRPEIALYPLRYLDSFIAFLVLLAMWMAAQFLYRSFRDHAV
jgi:capsular polysaccharide transport system permease protein